MRQGRTAVGFALGDLAERTGLEPATPGVTGRYSNQLNYRSRKNDEPFWWVLTGSNRRHSPCKGDALPAELSTRYAARQLTTFRRPKYFGVDAVDRIYPKLDRFGLLPGG